MGLLRRHGPSVVVMRGRLDSVPTFGSTLGHNPFFSIWVLLDFPACVCFLCDTPGVAVCGGRHASMSRGRRGGPG